MKIRQLTKIDADEEPDESLGGHGPIKSSIGNMFTTQHPTPVAAATDTLSSASSHSACNCSGVWVPVPNQKEKRLKQPEAFWTMGNQNHFDVNDDVLVSEFLESVKYKENEDEKHVGVF